MNEPDGYCELPVIGEDATFFPAIGSKLPLPNRDVSVALGGQAPLFEPEEIADEGIVRLGGQSPII